MAAFYRGSGLTTTPESENHADSRFSDRAIASIISLPMPQIEHTYALILAGGSGTRFWPLSRDARPKQLLDLFGDGTLLEQTIHRLDGLVPPGQIFILTNEKQLDAVRAAAPMLPPGNIIAEPAKRDTAPAVALGIGLIAARNPQATMMVLPADQLIRDEHGFREVMRDALTAAENSNGLVTIGIRPTWPCPSYGYIERGAPAGIAGLVAGHEAYEVKCFREKPSPELAEEFLRQGGFSWNAGMFVWSLPTVIGQLAAHAPELAEFIGMLRDADDATAVIREHFPHLPARSIDYALMEKADRILNIEASFDWDDVGSWISIAKYLPDRGEHNHSNTALSVVDSNNNIVFSSGGSGHVALLGVDDLIVVQTQDALLVANRHQADSIKQLGALLPGGLL
jgi:mannose-1-phosphate guanylyltransferase